MGASQSSAAWSVFNVQYPADFDFAGAGCMFVNTRHVLAAIHTGKHKSHSILSGFGGKRQDPAESWKRTAIRETIEELFDVGTIPSLDTHILPRFLRRCPPSSVIYSDAHNYLTLIYSFRDLEYLLRLCRKYVKSPLYPQGIPRTVWDILVKRGLPSKTTEIPHILLWSRYADAYEYDVADEFMYDLGMLNHNYAQLRSMSAHIEEGRGCREYGKN
jgi:hypothetical protein